MQMLAKKILFVFIVLFFNKNLFCITLGSDTTVAAPQTYYNFTGPDNRIANYTMMDNGFSLSDSTVSCSWDSIFDCKNNVHLYSGRLFLQRNLSLKGNLGIQGKIFGAGFTIEFLDKIATVDFTQDFTVNRTNLYFNSNVNLNSFMRIDDICKLDGIGRYLNLGTRARINVARNSSLILENFKILNFSGNKLFCDSNSAQVVFKNCQIFLDGNYDFRNGSILISGNTEIYGNNKTFAYSSTVGSTIDSYSCLYFAPGTAFSYSPANNNRSLIYMNDISSILYVDGASLISTKTGLQLTRGSLILDNGVTFSAYGTAFSESLSLGGSADSSLNVNILASANINSYGAISIDNSENNSNILYQSDFTTESISEWTPDAIYGDISRWQIVGDEMRTISGTFLTEIYRGNLNWSNYTMVSLVYRGISNPMGIVFYYKDENNYWRYLNESGYMLIRGRYLGNWVNAAGLADSAFAVDDTVTSQWYWYKAQVDNGLISVKHWLYGTTEPVDWEFSAYDNRLVGGAIGLMGWDNSTNFKNVLVTRN